MSLLEMKNIRKVFDGNEVLKDVSVSVNEGEIVSVIGRSGSGKSTLLRCAVMLEEIDGGEITYCGKTAARYENGRAVHPPKEEMKEIRSLYGMVFQNFNLFPHFTVLNNVIDPLVHVRKTGRKEAEEIGMRLLQRMSLADKAKAYPGQLSGGQKQRVAIARALALSPRILFFDEPTSALDPELTQEVLKVIKELAEAHMTMVIVTHEMQFARDISNRVLFMDGGIIALSGTPEEIFTSKDPRMREFLGRYLETSDRGAAAKKEESVE